MAVNQPHSEECERAVLASVLLAPSKLDAVTARLVADDFYLERHRAIFRAMVELRDEGVEIDLRTLQGRLEDHGTFKRTGGVSFMAGLDLDLPDLGRVGTYVEIVKERALRRRLIDVCERVAQGCHTGDLARAFGEKTVTKGPSVAAEAIERVENAALALGAQLEPRGAEVWSKVVHDVLDGLETRPADGGSLPGLTTPFAAWDLRSQGLAPGELWVVAGYPSMGKSTLVHGIAMHVAQVLHKGVLMVSAEMGNREMAARILAAQGKVPYAAIRAGQLDSHQWEMLYQAFDRTGEAGLHLYDVDDITPSRICGLARQLHAAGDCHLVAIDYLQLLQSGGRHQNRNLEVGAMARRFKRLAMELQIPVLLLSQLKRPQGRLEKPNMHALRDSGEIEQHADGIALIDRPEVRDRDNPSLAGRADLMIEKHRNGQAGYVVDLVFRPETVSFEDRFPDKRGAR
ncbi:MAG: DnaB-like helicase C-terminal domain-containing protein [Acidobacteriota bacterium]